jgi:hypothetical protein
MPARLRRVATMTPKQQRPNLIAGTIFRADIAKK